MRGLTVYLQLSSHRHAMNLPDAQWAKCNERQAYSFVGGEVKYWDVGACNSGVARGTCSRLGKAAWGQAYRKTPRDIATAKKSQARQDAKAYELGAKISLFESEAVQLGAFLIGACD